jgi:CubicO group peptidase (beta-lactamase class C family)
MTDTATTSHVDAAELASRLTELATDLKVPGAAVGIYLNGEEQYAVYGVTSIENPLPIDEDTLFQFGSTGKTYTATAIMRLVEAGKVDLNAPVRTYVPELRLKDEDVAQRVTVLQLLNHTAGWQGDYFEDTGRGDDAVARYVETLAEIDQVYPLGEQGSYNNAAVVLAGRVIENVTGLRYEDAIEELLLKPLGLENTFAFMEDIMTRRFVAGHNHHADGSITIARPWPMPRSVTPAGGWSSSVRDQLAWARFHLGDGRGKDGKQVLSRESLDLMQAETFNLGGSAIGDAVGISWLIKDLGDARMVGHGGSTHGQRAAFQMVPERDFAVVVLTNSVPNGAQLHGAVVKWALQRYLGIVQEQPEPLTLTEEELEGYTGVFESIATIVRIHLEDGTLMVKAEPSPKALERMRERGDEEPDDEPAFPIDLLPDDRYLVSGGPAKGMRGFFTRDEAGDVNGINLGARLATRQLEAASR